MHSLEHLGPKIVLRIGDDFYLTETYFLGLIVAIVMIVGALFLASRVEKVPRGKQVIAEFIVEKTYDMVEGTMGKQASGYAPYIGTIFGFLILGNGLGMFGLRPATADLNMTFALSIMTFFVIQIQGIRTFGVKGKLKEMCEPYPFMFPLKIIEQVSLPVSLAFRCFGNIFGGAIVMALVMMGLEAGSEALHLPAPFLQIGIPLPLNMFFDIFEPVLQAYIFTMLTMVFIAMEIVVVDATSQPLENYSRER